MDLVKYFFREICFSMFPTRFKKGQRLKKNKLETFFKTIAGIIEKVISQKQVCRKKCGYFMILSF